MDVSIVGGKARSLARLARTQYRVADGFCITAHAYDRFVNDARLRDVIRMELGRKLLRDMRWEEVWDAALRIRLAFSTASMPGELADAVRAALLRLSPHRPVAVRSSAPKEDAGNQSFAGLHESLLNVQGVNATLDAVRVVWASLWSDAALLYQRELHLNPTESRMAVVVQQMVRATPSGVAFGRDPRDMRRDHQILEAVPGPCADLVDGAVDPDHWVIRRSSGEVVEFRPGNREPSPESKPLLAADDIATLHEALERVEGEFGWPPDMEWTGTKLQLTILQARPITTTADDSDDKRSWYLSLRPASRKLSVLAHRVADELIPALERDGQRLADEDLESLADTAFADVIQHRRATLEHWRTVYTSDFIPFAHGVRQLGMVYNDAVRPSDPYEFVGLLRGEAMLASQRNQKLVELAEALACHEELRKALRSSVGQDGSSRAGGEGLRDLKLRLAEVPGASFLWEGLSSMAGEFMDIAYAGKRLVENDLQLLYVVLELAESKANQPAHLAAKKESTVEELEQRFFHAVGREHELEAREVLRVGRLSWKLRDDDNLLLSRVESQLLRALGLAAKRLVSQGRMLTSHVHESHAEMLAQALRDPDQRISLPPPPPPPPAPDPNESESPRQITGQPAAPGLASGLARVIASADDLARFRAGEILVCDAIQPTMTHLVPLAAGIVERRGGMLIHGAIIARELGIPCVNGVSTVVRHLRNGDLVTVDGYLGIVTVGLPELDLEKS